MLISCPKQFRVVDSSFGPARTYDSSSKNTNTLTKDGQGTGNLRMNHSTLRGHQRRQHPLEGHGWMVLEF
jgi:hypothetical protein